MRPPSKLQRGVWRTLLLCAVGIATGATAFSQDDCISLLVPSQNLTIDEGIALVRRYQSGEVPAEEKEKIANTLFATVQAIVRSQARIWAKRNLEIPFADLFQEGYLGFLKALLKFDVSRGVSFPVYAKYWIRNDIIRAVIDHKMALGMSRSELGRLYFFSRGAVIRSIRAAGASVNPETLSFHYNRVQRDRSQRWLERKLKEANLEPTLENEEKLLKESLRSATPKQMEVVEAGMQRVLTSVYQSLNQKKAQDGENTPEWIDTIGSEDPSPEEVTANADVTRKLAPYYDRFRLSLDIRGLAIFDRRVVPQLTGEEGEALSQLGDRFGVSKEAIRLAEIRVIKKFKTFAQQSIPQSLVDEVLGKKDYQSSSELPEWDNEPATTWPQSRVLQ